MDDLTYDGEIVVASTARELEEAMARIEAFDARAGDDGDDEALRIRHGVEGVV